MALEHVLVAHDTDHCVRTFLRWGIRSLVPHITKLSHLGPRDAKVTSLGHLVKRGKGVLFFFSVLN